MKQGCLGDGTLFDWKKAPRARLAKSPRLGHLGDAMAFNPHEDPAALRALQDAIYRDRILRARAMIVGIPPLD